MAESYIGVRDGSATSYVGEAAVNLFAMITIKGAIEFYVKTGMKVNRAYTPSNMLRAAAHYTGKGPFPRGKLGMAAAVEALARAIDETRASIPVKED